MRGSSTAVDESIGMHRLAIGKRKNDRNKEMRMIVRKNEMWMQRESWNMRNSRDPFTVSGSSEG
jgi:hypothetical protein